MPGATSMPTVQAADRARWRAWLQDSRETAGEVWLVIRRAGSATPGQRRIARTIEAPSRTS